MPTPTLEALLARTTDGGGDCRIWTGIHNKGRVPTPKVRFHDEKGIPRCLSARRMVYELYHGVKLPRNVLVSVNCECSLCIEPLHLVKTNKGEVARKTLADPVVKARHIVGLERVKQPNGKLDHAKAAAIRARRDEDAYALAAEFGISRSLVFKVWQGLAWRDYSNPFAGLGAR